MEKTLPDKIVKYDYDILGRLTKAYLQGSYPEPIEYTYDIVGRLLEEEQPDGKTVSYEYDLAGNRTKLTYPDDSYITYQYDQLHRLTRIQDDANEIWADYSYDERSRRNELEYANGTSVQYAYDVASRLLKLNNLTNSGQNKYEYTYDEVGMRQSMLVNDIEEHIYQYDNIYQLTDVNYPVGYESLAYDTTFEYDKVGNRSSVIDDGTTDYTANELNQYTTVGSIGYEYDLNGNLTYDAISFYEYDAENHLTEAVNASGSVGGMLNKALENTELVFTTGGGDWTLTDANYYDANDGDSAMSGGQNSWLETTVYGEGILYFRWKVQSTNNGWLYVYLDDEEEDHTPYDDWFPSAAPESIHITLSLIHI